MSDGYGSKLDVFEELQRANADLTARAEELGVEIVRLRALIPPCGGTIAPSSGGTIAPAEPGFTWDGDKPLPEDDAIWAAHPLRTGRHDLYREALRLVGARHSKGGLVDLVTWLLHRVERGEK